MIGLPHCFELRREPQQPRKTHKKFEASIEKVTISQIGLERRFSIILSEARKIVVADDNPICDGSASDGEHTIHIEEIC
jgi:hypothetical protein